MHTKLLLTASIALALAGNCFAAVKDGSYTTTVTGHNAPLTVTVDIKNGKISDISVKDLEVKLRLNNFLPKSKIIKQPNSTKSAAPLLPVSLFSAL